MHERPVAVYRCRMTSAQHVLAEARGRGADDEGRHPSMRRLIFDLIGEYGRHMGHADLLREGVDGRVGEDPPADWRPTGSISGL